MSSTSRNIVVLAVTAALLVVATAWGFMLGASSVSLPELVAWATGGDVTDTARNILENVRTPRVLAALLAGAALATSGALIQASLDNPLASPNVIGVNSGAGLFVLLAASLAPGALWLTPLAAFAGALVTALIIFALSLGTGISRLTVVLAGIAITTVFGAGMNTILIVDPDAYIGSSTFLVGGLSGVLMRDLGWPALYIVAGVVLALAGASKLNILALGDEAAHGLGLNVRGVRLGMLARSTASCAFLRQPRQPLGGAGIGPGRRGLRRGLRPAGPCDVRSLRAARGHPHGLHRRPLLHLPHLEESRRRP